MQMQAHNFLKEILFTINSEEELIQSFRLRDQKKLIFPQKLTFPMQVASYLTWQEPSGVYTYLVFKMPNWDLPRGIVFKKTPVGEPVGNLCNWCHSYGSSGEIGYLSVAMNSNVSNSYILCQDLSCIEKIEEASMLAGKDPEKYIAELYTRMGKLFENITSHKPD